MRAPINTLQVFLQQVENIGETGPSPNGAISERGATVLLNLFTGKLCQRLLHDRTVSFLHSRVWRYFSAPPRRDTAAL